MKSKKQENRLKICLQCGKGHRGNNAWCCAGCRESYNNDIDSDYKKKLRDKKDGKPIDQEKGGIAVYRVFKFLLYLFFEAVFFVGGVSGRLLTQPFFWITVILLIYFYFMEKG